MITPWLRYGVRGKIRREKKVLSVKREKERIEKMKKKQREVQTKKEKDTQKDTKNCTTFTNPEM